MNSNEQNDYLAKARVKCYRLLAHRARSEHELKNKLLAANFPESVIMETVQELKQHGLINDEAYAQDYVRWCLATKAVGKQYLRQKLMLKGIRREIIETALQHCQHDHEFASAVALARKKMRQQTKTDWRRLAALLYRRGFSAETIASVYRCLFDGGHPQ